MDLDTLRLLLDIARKGGFAAAARSRNIDPTVVSRRVADAEAQIGARLFHRTTRRLSVTEAGATYLRSAEAALEALEEAEERARGEADAPSGVLRLTTSVAFGARRLTPLLPAFFELYPRLDVDLLLTDSRVDLVSEGIDLAVRLGPKIEGDLICAKLRTTRYYACASPKYVADAPPIRRPEDLAAHPCLRFALPEFRRRWSFRDAAGVVSEVDISGRLVISNALALRDAAIGGLGPALLADWLIEEDLAAGRLVDLLPEHQAAASSFDTAAWLLYPSRRWTPSKLRAAIDFLKERLGGP